MTKLLTRLRRRFPEETVRYLVAGVGATLVNFLLFALLTQAFGVNDRISNLISITTAILFAYVTNKLYVFRSRAGTRRGFVLEFLKFIAGRLVTLALEYYGYILLLALLRQHELAAKAVTQVLVFAANYIISKAVVFRKTRGAP
ncbi:MAG: GtrA family protein [Oscillospiraceae bacterium]|jgi:putative flippase GtrA|nr:GtrA family protein [Oscillospiraceae bacterium]